MLVLQRGKGTILGTHGILLFEGKIVAYTLEEPWNNNQEFISCIPPGIYKLVRHGWEPNATTRKKRVWRLEKVPGRSGVLIHEANTLNDISGCIGVGAGFGPHGLKDSQKTLDELRKILPVETYIEVRA